MDNGCFDLSLAGWQCGEPTLGCNILLLSNVGYLSSERANYWKDLKADLLEHVMQDSDYAQLALIQVYERYFTPKAEEEIKKHFNLLWKHRVMGGHGNDPLILFALDLFTLRPEELRDSYQGYGDDERTYDGQL